MKDIKVKNIEVIVVIYYDLKAKEYQYCKTECLDYLLDFFIESWTSIYGLKAEM